MIAEKDFVVHNMPAMMARSVLRPDTADPSKWVRDDEWYERTRSTYFSLFKFLQEHKVVRKQIVTDELDTDKVVLRLSDFTDDGKALVNSQAIHKWISSFDRPGSKRKRSDVSFLEKQLAALRSDR